MFLLSVLDIGLLNRANSIFLYIVDPNQSNILDCYLENTLISYSVRKEKECTIFFPCMVLHS